VLFILPKKVMKLRIAGLISNETKRQLSQIKSPKNVKQQKSKPKSKPKPKPKNEEKINWHDMMDSNKRGLRRGKGGAWK
jgi:hypothetical protein